MGAELRHATSRHELCSIEAEVVFIFLGGIGVHNFYLGFTTRAVVQIVVTLITCGVGSIWGFIEGILIICHQINLDAYNFPLKDDC
ncbi:MAG: TM2 domain-containing protein [Monoglobus pectinilyticus]